MGSGRSRSFVHCLTYFTLHKACCTAMDLPTTSHILHTSSFTCIMHSIRTAFDPCISVPVPYIPRASPVDTADLVVPASVLVHPRSYSVVLLPSRSLRPCLRGFLEHCLDLSCRGFEEDMKGMSSFRHGPSQHPLSSSVLCLYLQWHVPTQSRYEDRDIRCCVASPLKSTILKPLKTFTKYYVFKLRHLKSSVLASVVSSSLDLAPSWLATKPFPKTCSVSMYTLSKSSEEDVENIISASKMHCVFFFSVLTC